MEDMIREEDFVSTKYISTWKVFRVYYICAFVQTFIMLISIYSGDVGMVIFFTIGILTPLVLIILMLFKDKNTIYLPLKRILKAFLNLLFTYIFSFVTITIIDCIIYTQNFSSLGEDILLSMAVPIVYFAICSIVIIPLTIIAKKSKTKSKLF